MTMILDFGALRSGSLLALVTGLLAACGGDSAGNGLANGGVQITKCTSDTQCLPGSHCGVNGSCTAECGSTKACGDNLTCVPATGRCVPIMSGAGGSTGPGPIPTGTIPVPTPGVGGSSGSGGGCAFSNVEFKQETPNVMLVVDRSKSMEEDFGGDTRWNTLRTALIEPTTGFVTTLETQIRFGLTMYTGPAGMMFPMPGGPGGGGMGAGGASGTAGSSSGGAGGTSNECPILVEVPIALNNYMPIQMVYSMTEPLGNTPTGESLAAVWPKLQALDTTLFPGPRVMVLATDGEPNSCSSINDQMRGRQLSEMAISAAFDAGIQTFVIGVGDGVGEEHLTRIANLGQGFPVDDAMERFYPANDPSELADAFTTIINGIRACTFDLNGKVDVNSASQGRVTIDGTNLTYMDPNGWHLSGTGQVVVDGNACQQIQMGAQGIDIWFPCGVFVPE